MILIADGGSTKCSWCLLDDVHTRVYFNTEGYNPDFMDTAAIVASVNQNMLDTLPREQVRDLYFYRAGVSSAQKAEVIAKALRQVFPQIRMHVTEDLLAAARALPEHGADLVPTVYQPLRHFLAGRAPTPEQRIRQLETELREPKKVHPKQLKDAAALNLLLKTMLLVVEEDYSIPRQKSLTPEHFKTGNQKKTELATQLSTLQNILVTNLFARML